MNKKLRLVWIIPNVFCYLMVIGLSIFVLSQAKELEEINRLSLFVFTLFAHLSLCSEVIESECGLKLGNCKKRENISYLTSFPNCKKNTWTVFHPSVHSSLYINSFANKRYTFSLTSCECGIVQIIASSNPYSSCSCNNRSATSFGVPTKCWLLFSSIHKRSISVSG